MLKRTLLLISSLATTAMGYTHMEPRQQHPVALTRDGKKLLALHSTAHSLSVFEIGTPPRETPLLVREISVSSAPVSVRPRTDDEVWVVNEASDSVSIVSLSRGTVIDTLAVADEPADVCFAAGKAFVSCSQARVVAVFDAVTREPLGQIPIDGVSPRALVASADGSRVFVASLYSGNGTTILHQDVAPPQPPPTNAALPVPPRVGMIVPAADPRVTWNVLDHDIAEINTTSGTVERWITGVGTHLFDLAMHPDGSLWCANTEALNLTRFEPELSGHFAEHRLTRIGLAGPVVSHHDLNTGIARATTPQQASIAQALAGPTAVVFRADGQRVWTAAFQSDRVAEIDTATGAVVRRIDVRPAGAGSDRMRGPRGLALAGGHLHVLNKISDTLTTIRVSDGAVLSEVPLGSVDPMPSNIRSGRGVLYDARLSGNGTMSCSTCHLDADRDGLAWDLGDPGGSMVEVATADLSIHDYETVYNKSLHPMKGPLVTQTLRGLALNDAEPVDATDGSIRPAAAIVTKFHWRGDKPSIQSFNTTFSHLMGGSQQPVATMDRLAEYLRSIVLPPNPNLNLDNTPRTDLPQGDAVNGRKVFLNHAQSHCMVCHTLPGGTDQNVDLPELVEKNQPMKNPPLRTVYQRADLFQPLPGAASLSGYGLGSDGTGHELPIAHAYSLSLINRPPITAAKAKSLADLTAFILSFDTGTAPTAGHDLTITPGRRTDAGLLARLATLETHASAGDNGLVVWGEVAAARRRYVWEASLPGYRADDGTFLTRSELLALLAADDVLTFAGTLPGESGWRGTDRNADGVTDVLEPRPVLGIRQEGAAVRLEWPERWDWYLETSPDMLAPWQPEPRTPVLEGPQWNLLVPTDDAPAKFFRLRRTW